MIEFAAQLNDFVGGLTLESSLRIFWLFFVTDFPRYMLFDIFVFFDELLKRFLNDNRPKLSWQARLRNNPPLVSIIIPSLNEADTLPWTVRSLKEQSYKNIEIIVVDDGSTDHTPEVGARIRKLEPNVTYLRFDERSGKSAALNYGHSYAKGEFTVFVDSDTTFDRDSILEVITPFYDPLVGGVSGNIRARNSDYNLLTNLQSIEYMFAISVGRRIRAYFNTLPIISGAFGAFRTDLIGPDRIGAHEPGPGNDSDMTIRIRKQGYKIQFAPDAICLTNVPEQIVKLMKQRSRWDRNIIKNRIRKHKDVFNPFQANFKLIDVISFLDSIFFHVVLAGMTVIYLTDLVINYPKLLPFLLMINMGLYFVSEALELFIGVTLSNRWEDFRLYWYLPIFNGFKVFLKIVRLKAYIQEWFFYESMRDPFAPPKVRSNYIKW